MEQALLELPQVEIETRHYYANGLYAREIHAPAGSVMTGAIHKHEHISVISQGRVLVVTEFGEEEVCAPATLVSQPGIKRVGIVLEDLIWTTFHACGAKTPEEARALLTVSDFDALPNQPIACEVIE
jgi:hypothetical protein